MITAKKIIYCLADIICITFSLTASIWLKFDAVSPDNIRYLLFILPVLIPIGIVIFWLFSFYDRSVRFFSLTDVVSVVMGISCFSAIKFASTLVKGDPKLYGPVFIIDWMLSLITIGLLRVLPRIILNFIETNRQLRNKLFTKSKIPFKNVFIVGAGQCGETIIREITRNMNLPFKIAGLIDDDGKKSGQIVLGHKILGTSEELPELIEKYSVDEIIIAISAAKPEEIQRIVNTCKDTKVTYKRLPGLQDIIEGKNFLEQLRNVSIEDLLRRDPVTSNLSEIATYITGQTVLITGAGGSIGSEICRQILPIKPQKLLLLGHGENSIFTVYQELRKKPEAEGVRLIPIITDIQDQPKLEKIFRRYKVDIVFHAAAHKHVPLMELNPEEAVKNNVIGTRNVAETAHKTGVKRFVMISTDKAVNPTSVMGASKRVAEKVMKCYAKRSSTRFTAVRFGNVLGSRGSVIPIFREQIKNGGPVTVTHPNMVRYFMTIPEASKLVIQAGAYGKGGEVFILDMGNPVKIVDLAKDLIRLSGFQVDKDIKIKFTGVRPGEKLYEELLTASEGLTATQNKKIFIAKPEEVDETILSKQIDELVNAAKRSDSNEVINCFKKIVTTFTPNRDMIYNNDKHVIQEKEEQSDLSQASSSSQLRVISN